MIFSFSLSLQSGSGNLSLSTIFVLFIEILRNKFNWYSFHIQDVSKNCFKWIPRDVKIFSNLISSDTYNFFVLTFVLCCDNSRATSVKFQSYSIPFEKVICSTCAWIFNTWFLKSPIEIFVTLPQFILFTKHVRILVPFAS